jgi:hypothetical protein
VASAPREAVAMHGDGARSTHALIYNPRTHTGQ